jgi:hypothetical protein
MCSLVLEWDASGNRQSLLKLLSARLTEHVIIVLFPETSKIRV